MSSNSNFQKSRSSSSSLAGADQTKVKESSIEKTHISTNPKLTETLNDLLKFPLMDAIANNVLSKEIESWFCQYIPSNGLGYYDRY
jgi:hypothetical protein